MKAIRVLIVDDAIQVRQDLHTMLTLAGNIEIVGEAGNGLEAIRRAEVLRPEVVLMDLEMPVLDGYEATRQIKARCPACRVVALTIHGEESPRRRAAESGVDAFVVKGAPISALIEALEKAKEDSHGTYNQSKESKED